MFISAKLILHSNLLLAPTPNFTTQLAIATLEEKEGRERL